MVPRRRCRITAADEDGDEGEEVEITKLERSCGETRGDTGGEKTAG